MMSTGRRTAVPVLRYFGLRIMRRLLTGGIKAILAIAALSTGAHWALRLQDERPPAPAPAIGMASIPEPSATGSIVPRKIERAPSAGLASAGLQGLDQEHLLKLISNASTERPKLQKTIAKR